MGPDVIGSVGTSIAEATAKTAATTAVESAAQAAVKGVAETGTHIAENAAVSAAETAAEQGMQAAEAISHMPGFPPTTSAEATDVMSGMQSLDVAGTESPKNISQFPGAANRGDSERNPPSTGTESGSPDSSDKIIQFPTVPTESPTDNPAEAPRKPSGEEAQTTEVATTESSEVSGTNSTQEDAKGEAATPAPEEGKAKEEPFTGERLTKKDLPKEGVAEKLVDVDEFQKIYAGFKEKALEDNPNLTQERKNNLIFKAQKKYYVREANRTETSNDYKSDTNPLGFPPSIAETSEFKDFQARALNAARIAVEVEGRKLTVEDLKRANIDALAEYYKNKDLSEEKKFSLLKMIGTLIGATVAGTGLEMVESIDPMSQKQAA